MESYLEIEYIKGEPSKINVKASNGLYSGYTETYINIDRLSKLGNELRGFPTNTDAIITFESDLGKNDESYLYLKFYCKNNLGKTAVKVSMKAGIHSSNKSDEAKFTINYEVVELDKFVKKLEHINRNKSGIITLVGLATNA